MEGEMNDEVLIAMKKAIERLSDEVSELGVRLDLSDMRLNKQLSAQHEAVKAVSRPWQTVLDSLPYKSEFLKAVLRSRRPLIPIMVNGHVQLIPRAVVRDYLRGIV
jgi:hypothetical protein